MWRQYLQAQGYRIVPINPSATEILGGAQLALIDRGRKAPPH